MREVLLALGLLAAATLIVVGVAMLFVPAACITAGVLAAALSVLFFTEVA